MPLATLEEFRADAASCTRRVQRTVILSIGGMCAFVLAASGASLFMKGSLGPVGAKFVPAALYLIGAPLMLYGFWKSDRHYKDYATLTCPQCGKSLAQKHDIVIASRNCPFCGRQVIESPASQV